MAKLKIKDSEGNWVTVPYFGMVDVPDDGKQYNRKFNEWVEDSSAETLTDLVRRVSNLEQDPGTAYCVGEWDAANTQAASVETKGDTKFALAWYPFLINHGSEATENGTIKPAAQLMKNNWFRTISGDFSPAVAISEDDFNAVDGKVLYVKEGENLVKYSDATDNFDHIEYYIENGIQPLYDAEGNELYVRKPWDTTSTDYSIMIGRKDSINVVDNLVASNARKLRGIVPATTSEYEGVHVGHYHLPPTALAPTPSGTIGDRTRNFFMPIANIGDANSRGDTGRGGAASISYYKGDGLYPRSNDMQQISNMNYARANNADNTKPYPFAEGGYHALNAFLCSMEAAYGTKYLHSADKFSSGTSSNDTCNSEATWTANGGVRYRKKGTETWAYVKLSETTPFSPATGVNATNWSETINYRRALWRVNEAATAASYAAELHIGENTQYQFMGKTYWYSNVSGAKTLLEGEMNARVYRIDSIEINAVEGTYEAEVIMRAGLMNGMDVSGDIYAYWGGGYELLGNDSTNEITPYMCTDQKQWKRITTYNNVEIGSEYGFEQDYMALTPVTAALTNTYTKTQNAYVPFYSEIGGSIGTGECHYVYGSKSWSAAGKMVRIGVRFRGNVYSTNCSPRYLTANFTAGTANRNFGGSVQCLLEI